MPIEKESEELKEVNANLSKGSEADLNHEVIEYEVIVSLMNDATKRKGRKKGSKNQKKKKPLPPELIQESSIFHRLRSHKK